MDNKRIIYSTRENIKSTLVIFLKYKRASCGSIFCRAADVIDAVCSDVSAGLDCRFTDGGKCRYADLDAGASGRRFDWDQ